MMKLRLHGGLKLVCIKTKSEASKIKWLMEMLSNPGLKVHLSIMEKLVGTQKGGLVGHELFFTTVNYSRKITTTDFYKEAIQAINTLKVQKKSRIYSQKRFFTIPRSKILNLMSSPSRKSARKGKYTLTVKLVTNMLSSKMEYLMISILQIYITALSTLIY